MDPKRILLVYYSRTGTTRDVALAISAELGCDIDPILEHEGRHGILGYLKSVFDSVFRRPARLRCGAKDPSSYDLVVVGTPIWNASVSAPVRTYLATNRARLRKVAFFCTYAGSGSCRTLHEMEEICGQTPIVTLALRSAELKGSGFAAKIRAFALAAKSTAPPRTSAAPAAAHRPTAVVQGA